MANFDFIGNRVFDDLISSFAPLGPQTLFNSDNPFMGTPLDTGAKVGPTATYTSDSTPPTPAAWRSLSA